MTQVLDVEGTPAPPVSVVGPVDRTTRLLCARMYFYGAPAALVEFFRILGPPCAGFERGLGADRRELLFHSIQALLLSLTVFVPAMALYWFGGPTDGAALLFAHLLVGGKIAIVNPWIARVWFGRHPRRLRLPLLGAVAERVTDALVPWRRLDGQNVVYFRGERPFVGYGAEINAWTVVIDTTVKSGSPFRPEVGHAIEPDAPRSIETAIADRAEGLAEAGVLVDRLLCVDGRVLGERRETGRWSRPPHHLDDRIVLETDAAGDEGRRYLLLTSANRAKDVIVTQFVRFSTVGPLIFCEFASHLVPPVSRFVAVLDNLFRMHPVAYAAVGVVLYALGGFVATLVGPVVEGPLWLEPALIGTHLVMVGESFGEYLLVELTGGWFVYRIIGVTAVLLLLVILVQLVRTVMALALLGLGVTHHYGLRLSYRERWSTKRRLGPFELQDAIRFLKVHEQVILSAVTQWLEARGIDASAFKETVTAFINQGVINTGQIGGSVAMRLRSVVFRGGAGTRTRRKAAA